MSTQQLEPIPQTPMMAQVSQEYAEIMMLGNVLHRSGYFRDVQDQAQAVAKILYGRELGFSPIVSMSGIYIIEGKPALSANLLAATIKRSGKYDYRIVKWTNTECELMFREKRDGKWEDVGPSSFNMEDAKRAGVAGKKTWTSYPKAMLFARALSQGERAYCPDVSSCALYVPEELGANVNESGEVVSVADLPKSAQPVAVTKEDIVFDAVGASGNAASADKGQANAPANGGSDVPTPAPVPETLPPVSDVVYVSQGQAVNFGRSFEKALRPELQKHARDLAHDWLRDKGYINVLGEPSSKMIPAADFELVKDAAIAWAKKQ